MKTDSSEAFRQVTQAAIAFSNRAILFWARRCRVRIDELRKMSLPSLTHSGQNQHMVRNKRSTSVGECSQRMCAMSVESWMHGLASRSAIETDLVPWAKLETLVVDLLWLSSRPQFTWLLNKPRLLACLQPYAGWLASHPPSSTLTTGGVGY